MEDQVVIQAASRAEPAIEDAIENDCIGHIDQQDGVDIVTLEEERRLLVQDRATRRLPWTAIKLRNRTVTD